MRVVGSDQRAMASWLSREDLSEKREEIGKRRRRRGTCLVEASALRGRIALYQR